jgi:hypothetical protein
MPFDPIIRTFKTAEPVRLGGHRRQMALVVVLIGLGTFFAPLIRTDSAILGRTRWSQLDIMLAHRAGGLPIAHQTPGELDSSSGIAFLVATGLAFGAFGLIAVSAALFPSVRVVRFASGLGAVFVITSFQDRAGDYREVFYGDFTRFHTGPEVHTVAFCAIQLGACGLLGWIAATKELD